MKLKATHSVCLLLILLSFCKEQKAEVNTVFDINGSSSIHIVNKSNNLLHIQLENWYATPLKAQRLDTIIPPSQSLLYKLKAQGRNYYNLTLNNTGYHLFTQPSALDTIIYKPFSLDSDIIFRGDLEEINRFILKKAAHFGSPDADWLPRAQATHHADNFDAVIQINDSVTQSHTAFLQQHSNTLPAWYSQFEMKRLKYLNWGFKLNSLFYRKSMLNKEEQLPPNFLDSLKASVTIHDPEMLGNMRYAYFLNDYIHYIHDSSFSSFKPSSKQEWQTYYNNLFTVANKELRNSTKDVYIASAISMMIDTRRYVLDTSWLTQVKHMDIRNFLEEYLATYELLPTGEKAPYFYLQALDSTYYEPKDFKNQILLINFWATWCKPCIKDFTAENMLVEKYKDEPVSIVDIPDETEHIILVKVDRVFRQSEQLIPGKLNTPWL